MTKPVGYFLTSTPTMRPHGRTLAQAWFHPPFACRFLQVLKRLPTPGRSPPRADDTSGEDKMTERNLDPEVEQVRIEKTTWLLPQSHTFINLSHGAAAFKAAAACLNCCVRLPAPALACLRSRHM
jgi:hypothetical protein